MRRAMLSIGLTAGLVLSQNPNATAAGDDRRAAAADAGFLAAADAGGGYAEIMQRVKQLVGDGPVDAGHCSLISSAPYKGAEPEAYTRITDQFRIRCGSRAPLDALFDTLESGRPSAFVQELNLFRMIGYAPPAAGQPEPALLDVRFTVTGYLAGKDATRAAEFLQAKRDAAPRMHALLAELDRRLPRDTEVQRINVDEDYRIEIQALSPKASDVVAALRASTLLGDAAVRADVLKDARTNQDSFVLTLKFRRAAAAPRT